MASLGALAWALVLMALVILTAAIYLEEIALQYMEDHHNMADDPILMELKQSWGGMYVATYSLIYSISGGKDWGDLADPFVKISVLNGFIYTSIILFITVGF